MRSFYLLCIINSISFFAFAQLDIGYQMPHQDIRTLADVEMPPSISLSPDGTRAILIYRDQYKSIEELAELELRLAGLRINPAINGPSRVRYSNKLAIFNPSTRETVDIEDFPSRAKISDLSWSPKQNYVAFTNATPLGLELWIIDYVRARARKLTEPNLNGNIGSVFSWIPDETGLLVKTLATDRPTLIDSRSSIPTGPKVSINEDGQRAQNRTYQDLLTNSTDEKNFETLVTSVLVSVSLDGNQQLFRKEGMYSRVNLSPDGQYVLISEIKRPFSYIVPLNRFPTSYDVYDSEGNHVYNIAEQPLMEELPKGFMATQPGMRSINWRNDQPATIYWVQALDGGDPDVEVDHRDEVWELSPPFNGDKRSLVKTQLRFNGILWGTDELAIVQEMWWNNRTARTVFFNPSDNSLETVLFNERNYQDRYNDPGNFVMTRNQYDRLVLNFTEASTLLLMGEGFKPTGKFPFIDEYDLESLTTQRIYQSGESEYQEDFVSVIDINTGDVLVRRESPTIYPNYFVRNIRNNSLRQITNFENPFKALERVHKEIIQYRREDGLELSATLYLPVGYDKNKKEQMPMIMWAYPREFKDRSSAEQVTTSAKAFTYPSYGSPIFWVNRGYVVLDNTAFPIVGEGEDEPNDSFVKQLVGNAKAAIDAVDALGYIDRDRVAVGGHSYGAFMTANLLSHSNLFAAGIARSGAYNRTLTPFGFQSEERSYWEAPDVYNTMSPFMNAHKMKTPMLLIHGESDNNSGTFPMQSERYFNALKGLGAPVRLVMLPHESHGYAAKESIMHMLWEQDQWLEKYVKNKAEIKP